MNTDCLFAKNHASDVGGVLALWFGVNCHNINSTFIENFAPAAAGVMALWYGVNCTNVNCNFTGNKGMNLNQLVLSKIDNFVLFMTGLLTLFHLNKNTSVNAFIMH